ncbi:MAG: CCA tRNA nucleotidyltransferase [Kiritimatiellaeota bacterium]|nr:CCA tRNA nucleotidyltransferase [Kiritimatiellota bacterium]
METVTLDQLRQDALCILRTLQQAGFSACLAGGCVRDQLMGRAPKDYDIATNAPPEEVARLFPRTVATGQAFGVMQVVTAGRACEVATFRRDSAHGDGRRPDAVVFSGPEEDARRRDFTINGLFLDPASGAIMDYVGGRADLERKIIRTIGAPHQRFSEDYLRLLRAVRFAATLEFELEASTRAALQELAPRLAHISAERIQQELTRLLTTAPRAGRGLRLLHATGLLAVILPEVAALVGQAQPPQFHPEGDVFEHTVLMLDGLTPPASRTLAWAVLLHDVGKPPTVAVSREPDGSERLRFNCHDEEGARMAALILRRLKMPADEIAAITYCIKNHMRFKEVAKMRRATLRQLVGAPTFPVELELHRLDCLASHGDLSNYEFLLKFQDELHNEPVLPQPWITGHDLLARGLPPGPELGRWRRRAYEAQLEGRCASREQLLAWLDEALQERPRDPPAPVAPPRAPSSVA